MRIIRTDTLTSNPDATTIYLPIRRIRDARLSVWEMASIARASIEAETSEEPETDETIARGIRNCERFDLLSREVDAYLSDRSAGTRADLFRHFPELSASA